MPSELLAAPAASSVRKAGAIADLSIRMKLACGLQGFIDVLRWSSSSPWRRCRIYSTLGSANQRRLCLVFFIVKTDLLQRSSVVGVGTTCVDTEHSSNILLSERRRSSAIQRTGILGNIELGRSCTTWSHLPTILRVGSSGSFRVNITSLRLLSLVIETISWLSL